VKNGSKSRSRVSSVMPTPLSVTVEHDAPGSQGRRRLLRCGHVDADVQEPARGHRVAGVQAEIHQHLLQLARIAFYDGGLGARRQLERDALRNQPAEHAEQVTVQVAQVDDLSGQGLAPAELKELAREVGGALPRTLDLLDMSAHVRLVRAQRLRDELAVVDDVRGMVRQRPSWLRIQITVSAVRVPRSSFVAARAVGIVAISSAESRKRAFEHL
jgi:hypothetical protein